MLLKLALTLSGFALIGGILIPVEKEPQLLNSSCTRFRLANYFHDHMVLQRGATGPVVWGFGQAGQNIAVRLDENVSPIGVVISGDCTWKAHLPMQNASGPHQLSFTSSVDGQLQTVTLHDVLFGDVWLCSGQSNMDYPVKDMANGSQELATASDYAHVRLLQLAHASSNVTLTEPVIEKNWFVPDSKAVRDFSAVCWGFGRRISKDQQIPIGLISLAVPSTPIRVWSPPETLAKCGGRQFDNLPGNFTMYQQTDSVMWNAMVKPLTKLSVTGVIWYQGEAEALFDPEVYACLFPSMISSWRESFGRSDLPFGFVQLASVTGANPGFPLVRWYQTAATGVVPNERLPNTFMAVAIDLGDSTPPSDGMHPRYKAEISERLSLGALATVYGKNDTIFNGPTVHKISADKSKVVLDLDSKATIRVKHNSAFEVCCKVSSLPKEGVLPSWKDCTGWLAAPMEESADTRIMLQNVCGNVVPLFVRYSWKAMPCAYLSCPVHGTGPKAELPMAPFVLPVD